MKKFFGLIGVTVLLASCSGGGSGVNEIDKLPRMTSPVITSGASSSSIKVSSASTGLKFYGTDATAFTAGKSRGMCEMFNLSRDALNKAAGADKILCYMQTTVTSAANKATMDASGLNMYDGNYHIITLNFVGGNPNPNSDNSAPKMKFKIVKSGDKISSFEMFGCFGGTTTTPAQTEYQSQIIDGDNVTINSKNIESEGSNGTWKGHFTATGKLDSEAKFTEKEIGAVTNWTKDAGNYNYQKATFNQFSDLMKVSAAQSGLCSDCCVGCSAYTNYVYSEYQLLNGTSSSIHDLAMGDGSVKYSFTQGGTNNESWRGDSKAVLAPWTSGDHYTAVNAEDFPTESPATEAQAIAFSASETWDCSGTSEATMVVDQDNLEAVCAEISLVPDGENSWIDCWTQIGN